ncbi:MAG: asparagine synthase-related protein [Clostridia bacterium]
MDYGPSHTPGLTYFKDIFELLPGHYLIYNNLGVTCYKYWDLETNINNDDEKIAINKIKKLVIDAVNTQYDDNISTMLSGGLDSSILTSILYKKIII